MHDALKQWEPEGRAWDRDAAAHLWRRAAFCAPPATLAATLRRSPAEAAAAMVDGPGEDPATEGLDGIAETILGTNSADAARAWLLTRMVRCGHQLREKLALFWHGHFATSILKVREVDWMVRQYRLFLDGGLGPFGDLLVKVTKDPAMLRWLDNESNSKGHPNENYARELFELFTLGDGNYTETDIHEAARAFTGWHILRHRYHFSPALHDDGVKQVLGQRGAFGGEDICRIALEQDACGRFLAGKLLRFFVTPRPAADVVVAFGAELKDRGYVVGEALKVLFASRYFYAPEHRQVLVKSPVEFVVGTARVFDARLEAGAAVPALRAMGQDLLAPPSVKGWAGGDDWINTATWIARVRAARQLAGAVHERFDTAAAWRAFAGGDLPAGEKDLLGGTGQRDLVHALLSLPEGHLA